MGKFTGTPGPWRVEVAGTRGLYRVLIPTEHELAAAETDGMDGGSVTSANAALIAASPELLEALQAIVDAEEAAVAEWHQSGAPEWKPGHPAYDRFIAAKAAISRATQTEGK